MQPPKTRKALWGFIAHHFGVRLPWKVFTPGHSSPFDFVADAFFGHTARLNPPKSDRNMVAWACRSGGKTLAASLIAALLFRFPRWDGRAVADVQGRVLSGSADQAQNMYRYWARWCTTVLRDLLIGEPLAGKTRLRNGELSILPASQRSVRGPKIQLLVRDEIDEIDPELWAASGGMLASRGGLRARTLDLSTWHRVGGPMGRLIDQADEKGLVLYKWNIWEVVTTCPAERHDNGKGCDVCPLEFACRAKAREVHGRPDWPVGIAAEATCGICVLDDVIAFMARQWDRPTWDAEAECKRPSAAGLVYADFDEAVHAIDAKDAPADLEVYLAVDWGYNVFAGLLLGVDAHDTVYLLDTYRAQTTVLARHAEYLKAHPLWPRVREAFCDPAGAGTSGQTGLSDVEEFRRHGIPCTYTLNPHRREVAGGIRLVRSFIRPAAGRPRFFVVRSLNNRAFIRDIQGYVNRRVNDLYIDDPVKPQEADHTMDALRYFFVNRMAGSAGGMVELGAS